MAIRDWLTDPHIASVDVDSEDRIVRHRELLSKKPMTQEVFFELYDLLAGLADEYLSQGEGIRIEIGSGSSLLKQRMPDVELTDLVPYPGLDRVVDATSMPYADNSLKTIFGVHCFHHLPDPYKFLSEVRRACTPGGGAVLIEPYYGVVASAVYKRLFKNEFFDPSAEAVTEFQGPMSSANQALSYIVFKRDKQRLASEFPELEVVYMEPIANYIRYLVSGGVNFRQLLPYSFTPLLKFFESALFPARHFLALHHAIVIRIS